MMHLRFGIWFLLFLIMWFANSSCKRHYCEAHCSPLCVVIKLQSIEEDGDINNPQVDSLVDFTTAYMCDSLNGRQCWEGVTMFAYRLARDKKFTNNHRYHLDSIEERYCGDSASVIMSRANHTEEYGLIRHGSSWRVVSWKYKSR